MTNTLAYSARKSKTNGKRFISLAPGIEFADRGGIVEPIESHLAWKNIIVKISYQFLTKFAKVLVKIFLVFI